ncbi:MAG: hypothetical protein ABWW69_04130 [Pyrodictiaceae archaeon]
MVRTIFLERLGIGAYSVLSAYSKRVYGKPFERLIEDSPLRALEIARKVHNDDVFLRNLERLLIELGHHLDHSPLASRGSGLESVSTNPI